MKNILYMLDNLFDAIYNKNFFIVMVYLQSREEKKITVHDIYELKRLEKKIDL